MAQNQILPLGSGLGAIRAPSLQGDANEAAFRRDASSGGILGQLLSKYPTQQQAIDARKSAQSRISDILGGLMGAGGTSMSMPDESSGMNIDGSEPTQTPFYLGEAARDVGGQFLKDFRGAGRMVTDAERSILQGLFSGKNARPLGDDRFGGDLFDVTGGPLNFDEEFGGTIPRATEDIIDFDVPPADFDGEMGEDLIAGSDKSNQDELDAMARSEAQEAKEYEGESANQPKKDLEDPYAAALADAMKSYEDAKAGEDTGSKDIDYYKKQFADATGIDVSGKVDKSQALMAFGLALMQNKAGKGFDVGKILSSVGEAGEKAMPSLAEARKEARAGQLAGGKYALDKMASDKAAELATQKAALDRVQELQKAQMDAQSAERLAQVKGFESRKTERMKAELDMLKDGMAGAEFDKTYNLKFATGQGPKNAFDIVMAYDKSKPNQPVIVGADPMVRKYIDGRAGIDDALELMDTMETAAREIAEGGGTAKFAYDKLNSVAKAIFPDLNTGKPTSAKEYEQSVKIIMGRFKRFLTQETGNGISNVDVKTWEEEILKKPTWFTNLDETMNALDLLRDTFLQKRLEFDQGLDHLYDPQNHVNAKDLDGLVQKYGTLDQIKGTEGRLVFRDGKIVRTN
jgi:hypothetical protein